RHVLRHRGELLAAILTAARTWFAADCPPADVPRLGSFEEWTRTVGGILAFAGGPGFLEDLNELYDEVDEDEPAWGAFLAAWHAYFGEDAVTVATVAAAARDGASELRDALPSDLLDAFEAKGGTSFSKRLGRALARRVGAVFDCYRLERHGIQHQAVRWRSRGGVSGVRRVFSGRSRLRRATGRIPQRPQKTPRTPQTPPLPTAWIRNCPSDDSHPRPREPVEHSPAGWWHIQAGRPPPHGPLRPARCRRACGRH